MNVCFSRKRSLPPNPGWYDIEHSQRIVSSRRHIQLNHSSKRIFLLLIVFQALHSIEEYYYSLWEVLAPARYVSGLVSSDLAVGFAVINSSIMAFGIWSYVFPVRRNASYALAIVWFWILLEFANSVGHIWFVASSGSFFPGIYTAPFLLILSCYLAMVALKSSHQD